MCVRVRGTRLVSDQDWSSPPARSTVRGRSTYAVLVTEADPLEVAAWRMAVERLASEDLPDIACDALVRGLDSPALRELAGQSRDDVRDSADLFRDALEQLGMELPDAESAHWLLARRTAAEIVAGRIRPGRGASELWLTYQRVQDSGDLRIFVGLASELDDHPEDTARIEAQIVEEAKALLDRPSPRCWTKLMAARERSSLSRAAGPDNVDVDLEAMQLSDGLRSDLARWDADFADALGNWPASGGFDSIEEAETFVETGERLVLRLQDELGVTYHVEYMPEPVRPPGVKLRRSQRRWRLRFNWQLRSPDR